MTQRKLADVLYQEIYWQLKMCRHFSILVILIESFNLRSRAFICGVTILSSHPSKYYWKPRTRSSYFRSLIAHFLYASLRVKTLLVMDMNLPLNYCYGWSCSCGHDVLLGKIRTSRTSLSRILSWGSRLYKLAVRRPCHESVLRIIWATNKCTCIIEHGKIWQLWYKGK